MTQSIEVQYLRPDQVVAARDRGAPIFLPMGPIEWHGPHLPLGVDPLRARFAAIALAEQMDGIVMPTLFVGTERERSPEMLQNIGFEADEYIVGMDFPDNTLKSHYFREEVFAVVLRNQLELPGGTAASYSSDEWARSVRFWQRYAAIEPSIED